MGNGRVAAARHARGRLSSPGSRGLVPVFRSASEWANGPGLFANSPISLPIEIEHSAVSRVSGDVRTSYFRTEYKPFSRIVNAMTAINCPVTGPVLLEYPSESEAMTFRPLGRTGLSVSPISFGAFKIGRNQNTKYPTNYALPDDRAVDRLLGGILDLGINLIDTAPAYGTSEERIGRSIAHRRNEFLLCSKVGETFRIDPATGRAISTYDFSEETIRGSVERSLKRLKTDVLDILLLHSDGRDLFILRETPAVETLLKIKAEGLVRNVGLSGKTAAGHHAALPWADVIMAEYNAMNRDQQVVIAEAAHAGVGVLAKKGLAAGHLPARSAIQFVLANPNVGSVVIGGLNLTHFQENLIYSQNQFRPSAAA